MCVCREIDGLKESLCPVLKTSPLERSTKSQQVYRQPQAQETASGTNMACP